MNEKFKDSIISEIKPKKKRKPKWDGPKVGDKAAGFFLAHYIFGENEKECTIQKTINQLKMNGYVYFNLPETIKYANKILNNEYNINLTLINNYLFPKRIVQPKEEKQIKLPSLKTINPKIIINGENSDFSNFVLYVYDSITNLSCSSGKKHNVENVTLITKNRLDKFVEFNVFHCLNCNKFYSTIQAVKDDFPLRDFPFIKIELCHNGTFEFNEQSKLKIYGYNVQKDGLSEYERKNLLANLLHYKILTKHEIIQILQFNISFHNSSSNFEEAIRKWENDLEFVQNYGLESQPKLYVDHIEINYKNKKQK